MIIYFILLLYIFVLPIALEHLVPDYAKRQKWITGLGLFAVFLILSLKAPSVGIDIKGYSEQYYISKLMSWENNDYVFFENGYIILEKIFSKAGFDFQFFAAFIYLVECLALYLLISKYSNDATMSLVIFVCYLTFIFSMSGLRQVIAMSVCIFAYLLFCKRKPIPIICGMLLIILAITFHRSAYIFFIIPLVMLYCNKVKKFNLIVFIIVLLFSIFGRVFIWNIVNRFMKNVDSATTITLGGNFLFLVGVMFFCLFTYEAYYGIGFFGKKKPIQTVAVPRIEFEDTMCLRVAELCVFGQIMFSGDSMLRTVNYFMILLIPFLPRMLTKYRKDQRLILQIALILFLLILFIQSLINNQLEVSHYKFFWEQL